MRANIQHVVIDAMLKACQIILVGDGMKGSACG